MAKPDTNVINLRPEAATIAPARPCWAVYEHWVTNENGRKLRPGVYWHSFKRTAVDQDDAGNDAADRPITDEWISSPVTVVARTTNSDDGSEGRLLRLVTEGGIKEWIIAMEVFGGSGEDARRALFGMGVIIALKKRGTFMEYLLDQHPAEVFATTCRPGWHESGAFVLPGRTIGSANVRYQASNKAQVLFSQRGELALWQSDVAAKCAGNPVLTLAIGCSLAGPLLSLVGVLGGGVHLVGDSSSGKSLAQLIGSSVWGDPGVFAASWDMTKGGLEIEASSRNDTILPLDEIKRADPKRVQEMAYSLANGQGKGTMTREREARGKLSWRLLTLSSGERSLSEHAAISGNAAHAGAELRMGDVNAGTRTHIWDVWQSGRGGAMSLLSCLLDHIPPTIAGADKPSMANRTTDRPRLVLVERAAQLPASTYTNSATATPEWRQARDQYLNHVLVCSACYAPTGRHCTAGASLRARYDSTPMESNP